MEDKNMNKLVKSSTMLLLAFSMVGCTTNNTSSIEKSELNSSNYVQMFNSPQMKDKPLTRWWIPGSKMDKKEIREEIKSMVKAGLGGAEIVPVSLSGGDGDGNIDWGSKN